MIHSFEEDFSHVFKIVSSGGHIFTYEYLSPVIRNPNSIL